jgi:predicted permease
MNLQFIIVIIIILLGYLLKKMNIITEKDGDSLSKVVFNITLPAVVIDAFSDFELDFSLIYLLLINIVFNLAMTVVAYMFFKKEERRIRGMLTMPLLGFNVGVFAYPLVEAIWGKEALKYFGMFDMGNAFIVFGVLYIIAAFYSTGRDTVKPKDITLKILRSIPFMTYILTLLLNTLGLNYPTLVLDIAGMISRANMPLSLLLLGIFLSFSFEKQHVKNMAKVLCIKYGAGLLVGILLYYTLPFEPFFRFSVLTGLILPASLSIVPYSVQLGYDTNFIGTVSNLTIVISILFMWIFANVFI